MGVRGGGNQNPLEFEGDWRPNTITERKTIPRFRLSLSALPRNSIKTAEENGSRYALAARTTENTNFLQQSWPKHQRLRRILADKVERQRENMSSPVLVYQSPSNSTAVLLENPNLDSKAAGQILLDPPPVGSQTGQQRYPSWALLNTICNDGIRATSAKRMTLLVSEVISNPSSSLLAIALPENSSPGKHKKIQPNINSFRLLRQLPEKPTKTDNDAGLDLYEAGPSNQLEPAPLPMESAHQNPNKSSGPSINGAGRPPPFPALNTSRASEINGNKPGLLLHGPGRRTKSSWIFHQRSRLTRI